MEKNENFKEELEKQYNILIQASEKRERKYLIIIIIILAVSLTSTIVSSIFAAGAFKNSKNINNSIEEKTNTYYETLIATFNTGTKLDLKRIGNGYQLETPKTISITNKGDKSITYRIKLTSIQTSLISTNHLTYTITSNNETSNAKELPLNTKDIITDVTIEPEETINYIINVSYTGQMEENDYSNYYNANIVIEQIGDTAEIIG